MTPKPDRRTIWQLVKVPAAVTLIVSIVRLVGELVGGPQFLFGSGAGGGFALIGITWLVPIFGALFGWRLAVGNHAPDRRGIAFFWNVAALGAFIGGLAIVFGIIEPVHPANIVWLGAVGVAVLLIAFKAWPALAWANLIYGLAARLPVIVITLVAIGFDWATHHVKLQPGVELEGADRAIAACAAQIVFWIPFTVVVGGLTGSLASFFHGRRSV
jgi:hypothetical protein